MTDVEGIQIVRDGAALRVMLDRPEQRNALSRDMVRALVDALDHGRVKKGDLVLLVGFGAGMTAASAILRWGGEPNEGVVA